MLDALETVPWASVHHAYGPASDVPGLLRALASDDGAVREHALAELYDSILHQGSRYPATALAVPFLFELAFEPKTHDRAQLIYFLVGAALGFESEYLPLAASRAEVSSDDEHAAHAAVAMRASELAALLESDDDSIVMAAAYALAWFPDAKYFAPLSRALEHASDESLRFTLLVALAMTSGDEALAILERELANGSLAAAIGLTIIGHANERVIDTLIAALEQSPDLRTPWGELDLFLARTLGAAATGREKEVAEVLMPKVAATPMAVALLYVVMPPDDPRQLNALQRRALHAMADHGQWVHTVDFGIPHRKEVEFLAAADATARGEAIVWPPPAPKRRFSRDDENLAWPATLTLIAAMLIWNAMMFIDHGTIPTTPAQIIGFVVLALLIWGGTIVIRNKPR